MSSIMAAAAMGALMTGASSSHMPARAAISPQERTGAIQTYRIPAGSMAAALNVIADENDLHVLYDARLTDGLRTPGLSGAYSVRDALGALLVGTRLTYEFSRDGHSVSIVLAQADNGVRNDAGGAEALPTIEIGAAETAATRPGRRGEPKTPAEGYVAQSATTALKTDVPLKQTPVTVIVVPTQVIRDQAVTSLQGAMENVSGVRTNADAISGYNFKIRGFDSFDIYRNNLPTGDARFVGADMANVERIEVLKGPASVLYGRAEPGGIINVVTKQPLDQPRYVVEQQFGSFAHYRTQWDFNSPVTEIPGLAWRVSGAYQDTRVFRDVDHSSRINIAPTVSWRPSDWTEFTVDLQYSGNIVGTPNGLVA
ncbi:MAG TPA: TonB-dependent receptor, partial [Methylosinus sp.]